ncbi:hypothetical protein Q4566_01615 [Tamlana sp. 2_MG-2023]|uniref:hypothetical protein n=1 Tax=unclassified Tamlana TaxID=2614803 RepID=UPI0026E47DDD|nr:MULTISPECIES: hypothetical protein [unclassified Tamlana]MDO6758882.1 hypothetical protein [Tamlana sp. 2_MG-2023]MDO6789581.1 hypothetical protein [Tamlana sp. 1_MG-2023]
MSNQSLPTIVKKLNWLLLLFPLTMVSQQINGKVYDSETTVKGIAVYNLSEFSKAFTDDYGNFTLKASVNDTISFHSTFHNKKIVILKEEDFGRVMVIELQKTINALKEILISNNSNHKPFNEDKAEKTIKEEITKDSKANPHLYGTSSNYGLDFVRLYKLLFKPEKSKNQPEVINAKNLDSLFQHDDFFNKKLLNEDLKIPESLSQQFFDYTEAQAIDKKLLTPSNKLLLLDQLYTFSTSYLKILEEARKN